MKQHLANLALDMKAAISMNLVDDVLYTAKQGIRRCGNIREIEVNFHYCDFTPPLFDFVNSIWSSEAVAQTVEKIQITTTVARMPAFLNPIAARAHALKRLREIFVHLSPTVIGCQPTLNEHRILADPLNLFPKIPETRNIKLTLGIFVDLCGDLLFNFGPRPPTVNNYLVFHLRFGSATLSGFFSIVGFLSARASLITKLDIRSKLQTSVTDYSCAAFVLCGGKGHFESLRLPQLEELCIEIVKCQVPDLEILPKEKHPLFSSLSLVAPRLTSLKLIGRYFAAIDATKFITLLADGLQGSGEPVLRHFEFFCDELTAAIFAVLYFRMNFLLSLTIHSQKPAITSPSGIADIMTTRHGRDNQWYLEHVRITRKCDCGTGLPDRLAMNRIARCFTDWKVQIDEEYKCAFIRTER
ncbi:hypothetical protein CVT24_004437 [Panaeolus cyanescens]|uniref:Uncharacterized protein n=1 Tax=Panaeolus cyanescens TaxID=181874 RepID=A0A409VA20_9AGAR|nr:hypothetical protein CVT24_004437 [Panaeolus cyanescens]